MYARSSLSTPRRLDQRGREQRHAAAAAGVADVGSVGRRRDGDPSWIVRGGDGRHVRAVDVRRRLEKRVRSPDVSPFLVLVLVLFLLASLRFKGSSVCSLMLKKRTQKYKSIWWSECED